MFSLAVLLWHVTYTQLYKEVFPERLWVPGSSEEARAQSLLL